MKKLKFKESDITLIVEKDSQSNTEKAMMKNQYRLMSGGCEYGWSNGQYPHAVIYEKIRYGEYVKRVKKSGLWTKEIINLK